jgi:C-terminal processing protease CtpA/Prc
MLKKICVLAVAMLVCVSTFFAQKISRHAAERDVTALRRILDRDHPAPTAYVSPDSLDRLLADLTRFSGDSIGLRDWEHRIRLALLPIGCGHTYLSANPRARVVKSPSIFPFQLFVSEGRAWVLAGLDSTQAGRLPVGAEVLRIGGKSMGQLSARLQQHQPSDGYNRTLGERTIRKDLFFNYLHRKYFGADSVNTVVWRTREGLLDSTTIRHVPDNKLASEPPLRDSTIQILHSAGKGRQVFYFHPERPDVGVLKIKSFRGKGKRLYRRAFRAMRKRDTPYLVIDLRDNLGGSFSSCVDLAQYVVDSTIDMRLSRRAFRTWRHQSFWSGPKRVAEIFAFDVFNPNLRWLRHGRMNYRLRYRPHRGRRRYDGQVFLLTNGWSFSASSVTATYLQAYSDAVLIGQETGGGARSNNGMVIPAFILPGSDIRLKIPQYNLDYQLGPDLGRGVMPDVPIRYTVDDVLARRDLEWLEVLRQIDARK